MSKFHFRQAMCRYVLPLICCTLLILPCSQAQAITDVTAQLRPDVTIIIDGKTQSFYTAGSQQIYPIAYDGTTYLPVRAIGELMGKNVDWNDTTKTITLSGARTTPTIAGTPTTAQISTISVLLRDDITLVVDGTVQNFSGAAGKTIYPMSYNGSTYLPLRAIGQLMGKTVDWNGATNTITLTSNDNLQITDADTFSSPNTNTNNTALSIEDAQAKALAHANVAASQATFTEQKLDWEDGRQVYELEFFTADGTEYDYEIDAATGEVISSKYETNKRTTSTSANGAIISRDQAQSIALAKVPGATAANVTKLKLDRDDGRQIYEVEIRYDLKEYEMDIDAATGTILEFDMD